MARSAEPGRGRPECVRAGAARSGPRPQRAGRRLGVGRAPYRIRVERVGAVAHVRLQVPARRYPQAQRRLVGHPQVLDRERRSGARAGQGAVRPPVARGHREAARGREGSRRAGRHADRANPPAGESRLEPSGPGPGDPDGIPAAPAERAVGHVEQRGQVPDPAGPPLLVVADLLPGDPGFARTASPRQQCGDGRRGIGLRHRPCLAQPTVQHHPLLRRVRRPGIGYAIVVPVARRLLMAAHLALQQVPPLRADQGP